MNILVGAKTVFAWCNDWLFWWLENYVLFWYFSRYFVDVFGKNSFSMHVEQWFIIWWLVLVLFNYL